MNELKIVDSFFYSIGFPYYIFILVAIAFVFVAILLYVFCSTYKKAARYSLVAAFLAYVFLILCNTILYREPSSERDYCLIPFWSYFASIQEPDLIAENILNFILFLPFGLLGWFSTKSIKLTVVICLCFSGMIELCQFVFKIGFAEIDDIIHNTLGCLIGAAIAYAIWIVFSKVIKKL